MFEAKRYDHELFMENKRRHAEMQKREKFLAGYPYAIFTSPIVPRRTDMIYRNWSAIHTGIHGNVYQTARDGSSIWFYLPWDITLADTLVLQLELAGRENLSIRANLNGHSVSPTKLHGFEKDFYHVRIPSSAVNLGHANSIRFSISGVNDDSNNVSESAVIDTVFWFWSCRIKGLIRGTSRAGVIDSVPLYRPSKKG
jgi:hypothetical protein